MVQTSSLRKRRDESFERLVRRADEWQVHHPRHVFNHLLAESHGIRQLPGGEEDAAEDGDDGNRVALVVQEGRARDLHRELVDARGRGSVSGVEEVVAVSGAGGGTAGLIAVFALDVGEELEDRVAQHDGDT
eukprot:707798-Hanusia_phi.AAC.1